MNESGDQESERSNLGSDDEDSHDTKYQSPSWSCNTNHSTI